VQRRLVGFRYRIWQNEGKWVIIENRLGKGAMQYMKRSVREFLILLALAIIIFVGLRSTIQTFVVYGPSMEPNFGDQQRLLVNKLVYKIHEPERGDVIVFHPPDRMRDSYIKRIIGLPGESVSIEDGEVHIHKPDGSVLVLDEPYVTDVANSPYIGFPIPENEYFVLGDNRNNTNDSRNGWRVPDENIIGKTWLSIWPPDKWGLAANYPLKEQIANATNE